ncbi:MAG: glycosyltransferase [Muribaculaceae bacterium]|nr:glycosyltransferase [Muribaculaceae bacterium]
MANEKKVTVIVPVYKVENYIRRCVDSLLKQDYPHIEIILVDDGSPDNSGEICDEYGERYGNIKVIHKPNGGLSSARKAGFEVATGELICFIDSDDYVSPHYVSRLAKPFEDYSVQLSVCGYSIIKGEKSTANKLPYNKDIIENNKIEEEYILPLIGTSSHKGEINIPGFVWIRMYRKALLQDSDFVSEREYYTEDTLMNILYARRLNGNIGVVNLPLYNYCVNSGSLTLSFREGKFKMLIARYEYCNRIAKEMEMETTLKQIRLDGNLISVIMGSIYNIGAIRKYSRFKSELKSIFNHKEVRSLFDRGAMTQDSTWKKIIYLTYKTKAYFLLYTLLKLRKEY